MTEELIYHICKAYETGKSITKITQTVFGYVNMRTFKAIRNILIVNFEKP